MALNILYWLLKEKITHHQWIDISPDTHVTRVFKRTGLVRKQATREEIIWKAKQFYPIYPGILDIAAFRIGKEVCHPKKPLCLNCQLYDFCPKLF